VGGVGCVEISNSTTPKMVTFSEEAVAAYDMLVNKRHGVESKMTWEASSSFTGNGDKWNSTSSAEETYSPPWVPQLEVAGHRGGLVAGSARQGQVWNTLLGAVGTSQLSDATLGHHQRKGAFEHSNQDQERTSPWPNQESKGSLDSTRTYEPWAWRSQFERMKEVHDEQREELLRRERPKKSILKDQRSKWEVSKVPRQKRVKLLTPGDKQTTL